jgi:hypothetical protein
MAPTTRSHGGILQSLDLNSSPGKTTTPQPRSNKKEKKIVNITISDDDEKISNDDDDVEVMIETPVEDAALPIVKGGVQLVLSEQEQEEKRRRQRKEWQHTDFNVLEKLGQGFSATVFKAIDTITGDVYALKQIDYRYSINKSYVKRELEIHTDLSSSSLASSSTTTSETNGIVQLYGHYYHTPPEHNDDSNNNEPMFLYLVLQYCPLTLLQIVQKEGALSESRISRYINEIVHSLSYLQQVGNIIHRDIKLANILVTSDDTIKLYYY